MPLLDAPLPRMAGRLSFMRTACKTLSDVQKDDLVIVGLPIDDPETITRGQCLAPRALRETSVYFGWHANPQFSHPVDVDDRRQISTAGMFERMSDLGDLRATSMADGLFELQEILQAKGATAVFLGGNSDLLTRYLTGSKKPLIQLGGHGAKDVLTLAPAAGKGLASDPSRSEAEIRALVVDHIGTARRAHVRFDLSVFNTSLSGLCDRPRLGGCALAEVAQWMSVLGQSPASSVFLTGLNPTLSGMGLIKTGQRLMVTALLSFIYAKLGAAKVKRPDDKAIEVQVS